MVQTKVVEFEPVSGVETADSSGPPELNVGAIHSIRVHPSTINALIVAPDGRTAYSGGDEGSVVRTRLSEKVHGQVELQTVLTGTKPVLALALSGSLLAVAQTSSVTVFDLERQQETHRLTRVKGRITALAWDPRGELIALGMANGDVYVWSLEKGFFKPAGKNSLEALEHYIGGTSAIVGIAFHPSAGAFFVAERAGSISMWRLLRTEREMGLRDQFAVNDQVADLTERKRFADINSAVEDMWLAPDGKLLFVSGGDGKLYSWKVRGLVPQESLAFGSQPLLGVTGVSVLGGEPELIVAASQDQRLKFICRTSESGRLSEAVRKIRQAPTKLTVFAQSGVLKIPAGRLRSGVRSSVIWGAEKSENLLVFDSSLLFSPFTRDDSSVLAVEDRRTGASKSTECQVLSQNEDAR